MLALAVAALAMPGRAAAWQALCQELWNPHGQTTPPAGNTTCPGSKGGQNEDGFYQVGACFPFDSWSCPTGIGGPEFAEPCTCGTKEKPAKEGAVYLIDGCGGGKSPPTGWIFKGPLPILDPTVIKYTENGAKPDEKKIGNLDNPNADGVYKHYNGQGDLMVCDAASFNPDKFDTNHDGFVDNLDALAGLLKSGECTCCYVPPWPKDSTPSNPDTSCPPLSIK